MARKKGKELAKTSLYIPKLYLEAVTAIKNENKIMISHQVELALKQYLRKYKKMLLARGLDLWS